VCNCQQDTQTHADIDNRHIKPDCLSIKRRPPAPQFQ